MSPTACKTCGRPMIFARVNRDGREVTMPLDARPVQAHVYTIELDADPDGRKFERGTPVRLPGLGMQGREIYISHFLTCPQASQHSRGGR